MCDFIHNITSCSWDYYLIGRTLWHGTYGLPCTYKTAKNPHQIQVICDEDFRWQTFLGNVITTDDVAIVFAVTKSQSLLGNVTTNCDRYKNSS